MIAVIDVHYNDNASATAGAVIFKDYSDPKGFRTYRKDISGVDDYVPGQFYRRELPYITAAGIEPSQAAILIANMHGKYRLPTILKLADSLSRSVSDIFI